MRIPFGFYVRVPVVVLFVGAVLFGEPNKRPEFRKLPMFERQGKSLCSSCSFGNTSLSPRNKPAKT